MLPANEPGLGAGPREMVRDAIDSGAGVLHQVDAGPRGMANANVAPGPSFLVAQMRP